MKRLLLLTLLLVSGFIIQAQKGSWKIKMNNKTILSASKEDEKKNTIKIRRSEWNRSGYFELLFTETNPKDWFRHFRFVDENDNELFSKDTTTKVKISLAALRKLAAGKKQIKIYTFVSPVDPNLAIRMRRVHLATLILP